MRCAVVLTSYTASEGLFRLTGFRERRVRPLCHLLVRQQTWQISEKSDQSAAAVDGLQLWKSHAISTPGVLRQASIADHLCQTATALAANTGGRYVSPLANRAQAMRANLLAKATTATLQWTRDAS